MSIPITTVNFSLFEDIEKYGASLGCSVPGQLKNVL
jgi:hypothetical protein